MQPNQYARTRRAIDPIVNHLLNTPPKHLRSFVQALQNDNFKAVEQMLKEGTLKLDETINECHGVPLILALDKGSDKMVDFLLEKGANPFFVSPPKEKDPVIFISRTAWYAYFQINDISPRPLLCNKFLKCRPERELEIQQAALACVVCEQAFFTFRQILEWGVQPNKPFSKDKDTNLMEYTKRMANWKPDRFGYFSHQLENWQSYLNRTNSIEQDQKMILHSLPAVKKNVAKSGI